MEKVNENNNAFNTNIVVAREINIFFFNIFSGIKGIEYYNFSLLPVEEQFYLIKKVQDGDDQSFIKILAGFVNFIAKTYLSTVGTLSFENFKKPRVPDDLAELVSELHHHVLKNDRARILNYMISNVIKKRCLTMRNYHIFGFRPMRHMNEDYIKNRMNVVNSNISFDDVQNVPTQIVIDNKEGNLILDDLYKEICNICKEIFDERYLLRSKLIYYYVINHASHTRISIKHIEIAFGFSKSTVIYTINTFLKKVNENKEYSEKLKEILS